MDLRIPPSCGVLAVRSTTPGCDENRSADLVSTRTRLEIHCFWTSSLSCLDQRNPLYLSPHLSTYPLPSLLSSRPLSLQYLDRLSHDSTFLNELSHDSANLPQWVSRDLASLLLAIATLDCDYCLLLLFSSLPLYSLGVPMWNLEMLRTGRRCRGSRKTGPR
jgi:hypothetical protein